MYFFVCVVDSVLHPKPLSRFTVSRFTLFLYSPPSICPHPCPDSIRVPAHAFVCTRRLCSDAAMSGQSGAFLSGARSTERHNFVSALHNLTTVGKNVAITTNNVLSVTATWEVAVFAVGGFGTAVCVSVNGLDEIATTGLVGGGAQCDRVGLGVTIHLGISCACTGIFVVVVVVAVIVVGLALATLCERTDLACLVRSRCMTALQDRGLGCGSANAGSGHITTLLEGIVGILSNLAGLGRSGVFPGGRIVGPPSRGVEPTTADAGREVVALGHVVHRRDGDRRRQQLSAHSETIQLVLCLVRFDGRGGERIVCWDDVLKLYLRSSVRDGSCSRPAAARSLTDIPSSLFAHDLLIAVKIQMWSLSLARF
ncbi:hypothetical protein DFJ77DRAFT_472214 [Powellomyces hirtus]|nr:hypothetical protein DFJ77DRAFT_472214 [Powellomyces hirtus]